jgi:hypothetical protein
MIIDIYFRNGTTQKFHCDKYMIKNNQLKLYEDNKKLFAVFYVSAIAGYEFDDMIPTIKDKKGRTLERGI